MGSAVTVKIPPGNSVLSKNNCRGRADQGLQCIGDPRQGMGLEREQNIVLNSKARWRIAELRPNGELLTAYVQGQAFGFHGLKMRTTGNERDLHLTFPRKQGTDIAADGTGTEDTDSHEASPSFCARPMR
jgi:hypothetical protein